MTQPASKLLYKHRKDCETALLARKGFIKSQPLLSVSNCTSCLQCVHCLLCNGVFQLYRTQEIVSETALHCNIALSALSLTLHCFKPTCIYFKLKCLTLICLVSDNTEMTKWKPESIKSFSLSNDRTNC